MLLVLESGYNWLGTMAYKEREEKAELSSEAVRQQLDRVLAHPLFSQSKRFERFLRHVTELALGSEPRVISERDLGTDVFHRMSNYDTEADPIVRVTASEIRKRLARYYAEPAHSDEIRIDLQKGCYVPEFHAASRELPETGSFITLPEPVAGSAPRHPRRSLFVYGAIAVGLLAVALFPAFRARPAPLLLFWEPLTRASGPVLVSYAQLSSENLHVAGVDDPRFTWSDSLTPTPTPLGVGWDRLAENLAFTHDLESTAKFCAFFGSRQKPVSVKGSGAISLSELRDVPAVFVGGFNNPWTARLLQNVRFQFAGSGELRYIHDSARPESREWGFNAHVAPRSRDLIVITRMIDSPTGQPAIFAGGFSNWGTEAASAFLTSADRMQAAFANAPSDWSRRNLQIVLETTVLRAQSGAPRVLALHVW